MSSTRDVAVNLAKTDPKAALERARTINDPWNRCQALAWVAWFTPDNTACLKIIEEAVKSSGKAREAYGRAAVLAWPIRALIERGHEAMAKAVMKTALGATASIDNTTSKSDALFLLWQAAYPLGSPAPDALLSALRGAIRQDAPIKCQQTLRDAALMLARTDPKAAHDLVESMLESRYRRQALAQLAEGKTMEPRAFFWATYTNDI